MDTFEEKGNESGEEKWVKSDNDKGSESNIQSNKKPHASSKGGKSNSRLGKAVFLASLGGAVKKYWKIGVHWLAALRDLLAFPFDARARCILQNST